MSPTAKLARTAARSRRLVLVLFFATGLASLVYQVLWLRALATVFGSTTYATATVLAAFMGGLALGSHVFGRLADRLSRPLAVYGALEIGVGVFALLFPHILDAYQGLHVQLQRSTSWNFYAYSLVRFLACSLILLVPTTLMGGTFPLMSRFYVRRDSDFTGSVSLLYGVNTAGAVVGVILAGFVLIARIGVFRTSLVAATLNIVAGAIAILLQRAPAQRTNGEEQTPADTGGEPARTDAAFARTIIAVSFLSGFASIAYELLWTRTLVFILDSFVYSFSIMLGTFLAGIALGSLLLATFARRVRRAQVVLALLFVLIGLSALATYPFFARLADWKREYQLSLSAGATLDTPAPWLNYELFKFGIASFVMIVPTTLMGAAFPLLLRLYTSSMDRMARRIGAVYASNTLGAIAGSFCAGFILIPFLGSRNALVAVTTVSVLTGALIIAGAWAGAARRRLAWAVVAVLAHVVVVSLIPVDVYPRIFQKAQRTFELLYYDEDPTATVTAHRRGDRVLINLNGLNVAGTGFNFLTTQKMQAHMGLLLHPAPENILQVGFGSGGTAHSVSRHASVKRIDCVELCSGVIEAADHFLPSNHGVLADPRVHLTIEDARNYILVTPRRYDIILSDSIHPTYAGNGTLYSKDYFALCREKLNPGGFVSFWMPTYLLSTNDYRTIIRSFQAEFPYVMIWYVNNAVEAYTIVIGRTTPIEIDVERIQERLAQPAIADDLAQIEVLDVMDVLSFFVMGPETVARFAGEAALNTDDRPVIEFRAPRSMSRERTWYSNLTSLAKLREPPVPYLTRVARTTEDAARFSAELRRVYDAVTVILEGHLLEVISYEFDREVEIYRRAGQIHPESRAVKRLSALATSRALATRAEELMRNGRHEEALASLKGAIEASPDPFEDVVGHAWFRTAQIHRARGSRPAAADAISRCLAVLPCHRDALLLQAEVAAETGDLTTARHALDRLRSLEALDGRAAELARKL